MSIEKKYTIKSRITNVSGKNIFFRWIGKHGVALKAGESIVENDAYPSCVYHKRLRPACDNDIQNGVVEVTIITDFPVEEYKGEAVNVKETQVKKEAVFQSEPQTKEQDPRIGVGTIEDHMPKRITLPGHEEIQEIPSIADKIFESDTTLTHEEQAGAVTNESEAKVLEAPAAEVESSTKATAKRRTRGRKKASASKE